MTTNYDTLIDKDNKDNNNIEPFDKIEQGQKRYIPNIPSVISDIKKNNINVTQSDINSETKDEKNLYEIKEKENSMDINNNNKGIGENICNYWNTFINNKTVSTIINPFQDDGDLVNKVYKIYSCITITLILIVILLSITLS